MTAAPSNNNLEIRIIEDVSELDALGEALSRIDKRYSSETVYQSKEFVIPWLAYAARRRKLSVILLSDRKGVKAVVPLVSDVIRRGPIRFSRLSLPTEGRQPPSLDARLAENDAGVVADTLLSFFSARGAPWEILSLNHLSGNSVLLRLLPELCRQRGLSFSWRPTRRESFVMLEGDWSSFRARLGGNHRRELRRILRRIDEMPGWSFEDTWPTEEDVPGTLARYLKVVKSSWKVDETRDEEYIEFLENLMRSFASRGDLVISWLRGPDGDGAALVQLRKGRTLAAYHHAYVENCPAPGPGTALLSHAIARAYDDGISIFDFSTSEQYIHIWNPLFRNTCHVSITKKTPVGWALGKLVGRRRRKGKQ